MSEGHLGWLRERGEGQAEVRPVELFFDLVYVLAVTQLTHHLLDHLSLRGAGETLLRVRACGPQCTEICVASQWRGLAIWRQIPLCGILPAAGSESAAA